MRMRHRRSPVLQSRAAFVLGAAFIGLFALIGSFLLLGAWLCLAEGDLETGLVLLAFGSTFFTAGVLGLFGSFRDRRAHRRDLARKSRYPDAPWRWFGEWKDARVAGHGREKMILLWCVAVFWSGLVGSMFFAALGEARGGSPVLVGALPFLAVTAGFYVWAIRLTLRFRKFGASILVLDSFPGVIGGELRASLLLPSGVRPGSELRARLACRRIDHGQEHDPETTLWHTEIALPVHAALTLAEGVGFRLEFAIPPGREPSSPLPEMEEIVWDVEVWGEGGPVDYRASFQVPVFETRESRDETLPEAEAPVRPLHTASGSRFDAQSRVRVSASPTGGYDFVFSYPRQAGVAAAVAAILTLATGACVWLVADRVPVWISAGIGALDLLLVWLAVAFFTRRKHVHVGTGGVRVRSERLGLGSTRFIPRAEIESIRPRVMFEADTLILHALVLRQSSGDERTVGIFIRSKREASWLAGRMQDALAGR